jgi:mRNA interferase MazF
MRRGDISLVALQGDYGKLRPVVIIQSDFFIEHSSVVVCPLTSHLTNSNLFRVLVEPASSTGLEKISQVMVDKPQTIRRERLKERIGSVDEDTLLRVSRSLLVFLGLAG